MSNMIPGFSSGSSLAIEIDGSLVAYVNNFSWSDDVAHAAVGGIGSYSYDAIEPLQYAARGSFSLVRYGTTAWDRITNLPSRALNTATAIGSNANDGNSMLRHNSFNPVKLLLSRTFDIGIYERQKPNLAIVGDALKKVYNIRDCRLTSYSITFTPGQLVSENIGFICIQAVDLTVQNSTDMEI